MSDQPTGYQVVQIASLGNDFDQELARRFRVLPLWQCESPQAALQHHAGTSLVAVTSVRAGLSCEQIKSMPALRAVCSWGVGYETLDVAAALERGLVISNTPHVLDDCVADLAWALLLAAARQTSVADRYVKEGNWRTIGAFPLSTRVFGKNLGILGMGRIGAAIARRAAGFEMKVSYHNRHALPESPYRFVGSLIELAREADFLILACPGGATTHHLVNADVLRALGPRGILVNIARGSVIDQIALETSLRNGELGGAGLDVLENEPFVPDSFKHMDQLVLTPHVGSATRETRVDMAQLVLENVVSFLDRGRLLTPIPETPDSA